MAKQKPIYGGFIYGNNPYSSETGQENATEASLVKVGQWPIGSRKRTMQNYYMTAYRVSVQTDTEGPTIVYGFIGR